MRDQTVQEGVKAWRTGHITSRRNEGKKRQEPCGKSLLTPRQSCYKVPPLLLHARRARPVPHGGA